MKRPAVWVSWKGYVMAKKTTKSKKQSEVNPQWREIVEAFEQGPVLLKLLEELKHAQEHVHAEFKRGNDESERRRKEARNEKLFILCSSALNGILANPNVTVGSFEVNRRAELALEQAKVMLAVLEADAAPVAPPEPVAPAV